MLKKSKYNMFWESKNTIFAYNSYQNAFLKLENREEYKLIKHVLENPNNNYQNNKKKFKIKNKLEKYGFLLKKNINEKLELEMIYKRYMYNNDGIGLTLMPTDECNFRCEYCFENHGVTKMNEKVINSLKKYVNNNLKKEQYLHINWFGGEPTLEMGIIENLTNYFFEICEERECNYNSYMVTNGYKLTEKLVDKCLELKILKLQITLDGPPVIHNKRRPGLNGEKTFEKILENIKIASKKLKISIRINIDKNNIDSIKGLFDIFKDNSFDKNKNISIYFGHVQSYTEACKDIESSCFHKSQFVENEVELLKYALIKGFMIRATFPSLRNNYCTATKFNTMTIAPDGNLYKCWNNTTIPDKSYGNINNHQKYKTNNLAKWMLWNPFKKKIL